MAISSRARPSPSMAADSCVPERGRARRQLVFPRRAIVMSERRNVFPLPATVEAIDRPWLTAALAAQTPGVEVLGFTVEDVFNATSTSIRLRLELNEAGLRAGIPENVYVKGGFQAHSRELAPMHRLETLGYRDLLPGG